MKFAVVCSSGLGDGLILLIASFHLRKLGHEVVTFNPHLSGFGSWLNDDPANYHTYPADWVDSLKSFDAVLLQHDNTASARQIVAEMRGGRLSRLPLYIFYPSYRSSKHGPLTPHDIPFDERKTMVENVCAACQNLFGQNASADNGLRPPPHLTHRKYRNRVLLHPVSGAEEKNWTKKKFLQLKNDLQRMSYDPLLILPPLSNSCEKQNDWPPESSMHIDTPEKLASLIYESDGFIGNDSGPGHLASYLSIPHLIIGRSEKSMRLWRPGWHPGIVLLPPRWIPNGKPWRLREKMWRHLITKRSVISNFIKLTH